LLACVTESIRSAKEEVPLGRDGRVFVVLIEGAPRHQHTELVVLRPAADPDVGGDQRALLHGMEDARWRGGQHSEKMVSISRLPGSKSSIRGVRPGNAWRWRVARSN
jgi:hypothetical protein